MCERGSRMSTLKINFVAETATQHFIYRDDVPSFVDVQINNLDTCMDCGAK